MKVLDIKKKINKVSQKQKDLIAATEKLLEEIAEMVTPELDTNLQILQNIKAEITIDEVDYINHTGSKYLVLYFDSNEHFGLNLVWQGEFESTSSFFAVNNVNIRIAKQIIDFLPELLSRIQAKLDVEIENLNEYIKKLS